MQTMARGLTWVFGVIAGGCSVMPGAGSHDAAVGDTYLGNWQGAVVQAGAPRPSAVEIDLQREADGRLRAVSLYPEFGCVGKLVARKAEPQRITFEEVLEPAQHCSPRWEFSLIWAIDGRVLYASVKPPAQGTLARASPSAGMRGVLTKFFGAREPAAAATAPARSHPSIGEVAQTVDSALVRWSQVWPSDRYILGSPRIGEVYWKQQAHVVNGRFEVERKGRKLTVPFAAELRPGPGQPRLTGLCTQDGDLGQRCYDADRVAQETRQRDLKLLLALGLVGLIAGAASDAPQPDCGYVVTPATGGWGDGTDAEGKPVYRTYQCREPLR